MHGGILLCILIKFEFVGTYFMVDLAPISLWLSSGIQYDIC